MANEIKKHSTQAYLCVFGAFLTQLSIGAVQYSFGNLLPYIASYLASKDGNSRQKYNYYVDNCAWIYVARTISFAFGSILSGSSFMKKIGGKYTILIGDIVMSGSVAITYFTTSSLIGMMVTYGMMTGLGSGISYVWVFSIAMEWFPNNKDFIAGIVGSGYGLSALLFSVITTNIINPTNVKLNSHTGFLNEDQVLDNVSSSFWKLALIYFGMQLIALLFINEIPKTLKQMLSDDMNDDKSDIIMAQMSNKKMNEQTQLLQIEEKTEKLEIENKRWIDKCFSKYDLNVLKQFKFWSLWLTLFFSQMSVVFFASQWKVFTNQVLHITDDKLLSFMGSFASIANAGGRAFFGYVRNNTTYIKTLSVMTICDGFLIMTWPFLGEIHDYVSNVTIVICAFVWLGGMYFFQIAIYNIMIGRVAEIYGFHKVVYYYSLLMTNQIISSIIAQLVVTSFKEAVGWTVLAIINSSFQFIAFVFVITSSYCM
eukprot:527280_1